MSTTSPSTAVPGAGAPLGGQRMASPVRQGSQIDTLIRARIDEAARALWWSEVIRSVLTFFIFSVAATVAWLIFDQWVYESTLLIRSLVFVSFTVAAGGYLWKRLVPVLRSRVNDEYAAQSIERDLPELRQSLTSYVTLSQSPAKSKLGETVLRNIGAQAAGRLGNHDALPEEATGTLKLWIASAVAMLVLVLYVALSPKNSLQTAVRALSPLSSVASAKRVQISEITPGDAEALAGRTVAITAIVDGLRDGELVTCDWQSASRSDSVEMTWNESEKHFVGRIEIEHSASGEITYVVAAGDAISPLFRLRIKDIPVVALQTVHYQPPAYTGKKPYATSSGTIRAVDGTKIQIVAHANRPVSRAAIEFNPQSLGGTVRATAGTREMTLSNDGQSLTIEFVAKAQRGRAAAVQLDSYRIRVWDEADQTNQDPIVYPIEVIEDLPPEVSIVLPRQTPKDVPVIDQQIIEVHAIDPDFGLSRVELQIRRGLDSVAQPVLWSNRRGAKGNQVSIYRFRPSDLQLRVGDIVKIRAVATDNRAASSDPSIEPNQIISDAIELRIVPPIETASADRESDGLSKRDQQPTTESGDSDDESDQQGGGSADGAASSQSGSGKPGDESGGSGSQGGDQEGETEPQEGSGGGDSQADDSTGENTGESDGSDDGSGQSTGESADMGGNDTPPSDESADPGDGAAAEQPPGGGADPSEQPMGADDQQAEGQTSDADASASKNAGTSSDATSGTNQTRGSDSSGSDGGENSDSNSKTGEQQPREPEHDAEAFERIKDYLENQKNEPQDNGGSSTSGDQSGPKTDNQGSDKPQQGTKAGEPAGSGRSETSDSEQGAGSEQNPDGGDESNPSGGDESDSDMNSDPSTEQPAGTDSGGSDPSGESDTGASEQTDAEGSEPRGSDQPGDGAGDSESAAGDQTAGQDAGTEASTDTSPGETPDASSSDASSDNSGGVDSAGDNSPSDGTAGDSATDSDSGDPGKSSSAEGQPKKPTSESGSESVATNSSASGGQTTDDRSGDSSSNSSNGANTDDSTQGDQSSAALPDPVDLNYAKKATDLVLDYLDETRDAPDQKLLDDLNWSAEDLRRFQQRWQNVREIDPLAPADSAAQQNALEALESLGLQPAKTNARQRGMQSQSLPNLRDAGNRSKAPPSIRDAFDAFRRAAGQ